MKCKQTDIEADKDLTEVKDGRKVWGLRRWYWMMSDCVKVWCVEVIKEKWDDIVCWKVTEIIFISNLNHALWLFRLSSGHKAVSFEN